MSTFPFQKEHIDVYRIRRYRKLENVSNLPSDLLFIHGITFALSRARQAVFSGPTVKRMRSRNGDASLKKIRTRFACRPRDKIAVQFLNHEQPPHA